MARFSPRLLSAAVAMLFAGSAALAADAFPSKPIRILVTAGAGANLDTLTRAVGDEMGKSLGQAIVVENVTGAGGLLALRQVAHKVPADGYTLVAAANTIALLPAFKKEPGYDPRKDFVGIGDMQNVPYLLVGPANQPNKTVKELIAAAKTKPGELSFGSGGIGTSTHLPGLMFAHQAGIDMTHVPYKGNGPAIVDLVGGRLNLLFDAAVTAVPMVKEGKLRAYAVSTAQRVADLPDVPTLAEQGLPQFDYKAYLALYAPAATPPAVVQRLHAALRSATQSAAMRDYYKRSASEPGTMTSEAFTAFFRQDAAASDKLVSGLGIQKD